VLELLEQMVLKVPKELRELERLLVEPVLQELLEQMAFKEPKVQQELEQELAEQEVQELLEQMAFKEPKGLREQERHRELPVQVMRALQVILDQPPVQQMQVL
jgi:chemotaxis methyl-accepting protein methylase